MMMYDELVKSLRICSKCDFGQNCWGCKQKSDDVFCCDKLLHEAADAIEELQKRSNDAEIENIKLKEEFAKYRGKNRWIPVTERLPEADVAVLARYEYTNSNGKKWTYTCRASYIPKFTVLIEDKWNDCDGSWEDYNEDDDSFYVPKGWYEETSEGNGDGMSWFINATVTHWMPLPEPPKEKAE